MHYGMYHILLAHSDSWLDPLNGNINSIDHNTTRNTYLFSVFLFLLIKIWLLLSWVRCAKPNCNMPNSPLWLYNADCFNSLSVALDRKLKSTTPPSPIYHGFLACTTLGDHTEGRSTGMISTPTADSMYHPCPSISLFYPSALCS